MKSNIEEFCKLKFDEFVRGRLSYSSICWESVAQEDEPPDYYLYLNGIKYAVEVTVLMEKIEIGGGVRLPRSSIVASLSRLVDDVETSARYDNSLHGAYVVKFSHPITNYKNVRGQLFNNLLAYIKATRDRGSAPEQVVYKRGSQRCTITKMHNRETYVGHIGPSGGKWEGEIIEEICSLVRESVNSKCRKLSKLAEPKILLLYDSYLLADSGMYRQCVSRLSVFETFHTVFVVRYSQNGFILTSVNTDWL